MPVKIRLQRQGKKGHPYFHIVVADVRAPRDGKYIERLGFYNPNTNPATIELDVDGAVKWLNNGAQPTDTARAILGYKGVLYKNHLAKGVKKGAFDEAEADKRFNAWLEEKQGKIEGKKANLASESTKAAADRMQAEVTKNQERAAAIAAANAPVVEEVAEEEAPAAEAPAEEGTPVDAVEEAPVAEEAASEVQAEEAAPDEEPKAEEPKAEEAKAEEPAEEVKAEADEKEEDKN